jgi:hypothetical protein
MSVVKIIKKGLPVFAVKKKVSELDESKLSQKFKTHGFTPDTEVYVKCYEDGTLDLRGNKEEYRLIPVPEDQVKHDEAYNDYLLKQNEICSAAKKWFDGLNKVQQEMVITIKHNPHFSERLISQN